MLRGRGDRRSSSTPLEPSDEELTPLRPEAKAWSLSAFVSTYLPALVLATGVGIALPATPKLAQSFHLGFALASGVTTSFLLGGVFGTLPSGWLIDRLGRRRVMLLGPILTAAMAFATVTAHSFLALLIYRFIDGAAAQMWLLGRLAAISHNAAPNQRGKQVTWMFGMDNSGKALGPSIGGVIATHFGVRAPFAAYGVLALLAVIPAFVYAKDTPRSDEIATPSSDGKPKRTITIRQIVLPRLVYFGVAFFASVARGPTQGNLLNLYVAFAYRVTPEQLGFIATAAGAISIPIGFVAGWMMDRFGRKRTMVPGFASVTLSMVLLALSAYLHLSLEWYIAIFVASTIAQSLTTGSVQTVGADIAPPEARGLFLGLWRFAGQGGIAISPVVFALLAAQIDYGSAFVFIAAASGACTYLLMFKVPETHRQPPKEAPVVAKVAS